LYSLNYVVELQDRWHFSVSEDTHRRCTSDAHRPPIEDEEIITYEFIYIKMAYT